MLKVWIPGTYDTVRDYGICNTQWVNDNVTISDDGMFGKCLSFAGSGARLSTTEFDLSNKWSFAVWLKDSETISNWRVVFMLNTSGSDADTQMAFWVNANYNVEDNYSRVEVCANGQWNSSIPYTPGIWNHFAATFDGTRILIYINGAQVATKVISNAIYVRHNLTIGGRSNSANGGHGGASNYYVGLMNDLRIYDDEILSPKYIAELAKGLVRHYKFDRDGFGGDNLIINSNNIGMTGSDGTVKPVKTFDSATHIGRVEITDASETRQNSWVGVTNNLGGGSKITELTTGQNTYTFSIDVRVKNYVGGNILVYIDFRTGGTVSTRFQRTITADDIDGNWHRYYGTNTTNDTQNTSALMGISFTDIASPMIVEYKNPKLEVGDIPTPWTPHQNDVLYHNLGLSPFVNQYSALTDLSEWTKETNVTVTASNGQFLIDNARPNNITARWGIYKNAVAIEQNTDYFISFQTDDPNSVRIQLCTNGSLTMKLEKPQGSTTWTFNSGTTLGTAMRIYIFPAMDYSYSMCKIWDFTFGKGSSPNANVNRNVVKDCCCYSNHAKLISGIINYSSSTPRYLMSSVFDGASYLTATSLPPTTQSVSLWIKTDEFPSGNSVVFADYGSRIALGFNASNSFIVHCGSSSGGTGSRVLDNGNYNVGEWNHFAIIKTGNTTYTTYLNGVALTATANNYWIHSTDNLMIGKRSTGAYYTGMLSDFRAYATQLTEDQVIDLYHTGQSLDSSGRLYVGEIVNE